MQAVIIFKEITKQTAKGKNDWLWAEKHKDEKWQKRKNHAKNMKIVWSNLPMIQKKNGTKDEESKWRKNQNKKNFSKWNKLPSSEHLEDNRRINGPTGYKDAHRPVIQTLPNAVTQGLLS